MLANYRMCFIVNLYIIGNGFDLNLGLNTSYQDFYKFLSKNYSDFLKSIADVFIADNVTDPLWSRFEEELSRVNFSFFTVPSEYYNNGKIVHTESTMSISKKILIWKEYLSKYFKEWISFTYQKPNFKKEIFNTDDYFINFNYTSTLEDCFNVQAKQIYYIHGNASDRNSELIFGHGLSEDITELCNDAKILSNGYINCTLEELNDLVAMNMVLQVLRKPVEKLLKNLNNSQCNINNANKIVVLGHSIGKVDIPYFKWIREKVDNKVKWFFSYYSENDLKHIESVTKQLNITEYKCDKINQLIYV